MEKQKLLIATKNQGKLEEIKHFLNDLPFALIALDDLGQAINTPEETGETIEVNALLKAKYYAEKTGLLSLADDAGLFIDALGGWPGSKSARIKPTKEERTKFVLERLTGIVASDRGGIFKTVIVIYDPLAEIFFSAAGQLRGMISDQPAGNGELSWGYYDIFYVQEMKKTYAELTITDKNAVSHRGQALVKIKHYLQNQYGPQHIVVPLALIIKEGKLLLARRNDPHRPQFHQKWELPGGRMEANETLASNLRREVKEETGYEVEIVRRLNYVEVCWQPEMRYQVYLLPHVCRIVGGDGAYSDAEILQMEFVELDAVFDRPLLGRDPELLKAIWPELQNIIRQSKL